MLSEREVSAAVGSTAYGANGDKLGTVEHFFVDDRTGAPTWVAVATGLFGTRHSIVPAGEASFTDGAHGNLRRPGGRPGLRRPVALCRVAADVPITDAVVPAQLGLGGRVQVAGVGYVRGVLHGLLLHRQPQGSVGERGVEGRHDRVARAEQARGHRHPGRGTGAVVDEEVLDRPDLVAVGVVGGAPDGGRQLPVVEHGGASMLTRRPAGAFLRVVPTRRPR